MSSALYRPARFLGTPSLLPFFSENAYFFPGNHGGGGCCVFLQFKSPPSFSDAKAVAASLYHIGPLYPTWLAFLANGPPPSSSFPPFSRKQACLSKIFKFLKRSLRRRGRNSETDDGSLGVPPLHVGFVKKLHPKTHPTLFLMSPQDKLLIFCSVKNGAGLMPHFSFFIFFGRIFILWCDFYLLGRKSGASEDFAAAFCSLILPWGEIER